MTYTNDEIKAIAEQHLANAEWFDETQQADTTFGFRMGFSAAIQMHNLQQTPCSTQLPPSDYDLERLYDWIMDENRKPAKTAFTSGSLRKVADEIEFRLWRQLS